MLSVRFSIKILLRKLTLKTRETSLPYYQRGGGEKRRIYAFFEGMSAIAKTRVSRNLNSGQQFHFSCFDGIWEN